MLALLPSSHARQVPLSTIACLLYALVPDSDCTPKLEYLSPPKNATIYIYHYYKRPGGLPKYCNCLRCTHTNTDAHLITRKSAHYHFHSKTEIYMLNVLQEPAWHHYGNIHWGLEIPHTSCYICMYIYITIKQ